MAPSNFARLEPRALFDKAVVFERKDGYLTYSYWHLIYCVVIDHKMDTNDPECFDDARDWVDFNIVSLAPEAYKISYSHRSTR